MVVAFKTTLSRSRLRNIFPQAFLGGIKLRKYWLRALSNFNVVAKTFLAFRRLFILRNFSGYSPTRVTHKHHAVRGNSENTINKNKMGQKVSYMRRKMSSTSHGADKSLNVRGFYSGASVRGLAVS